MTSERQRETPSNEDLAAWIQAGRDAKGSMALLYEQIKPYLRSVAWRYRGHGVDLEDLEQEAFMALYDAAAGYDPGQGASFVTYADRWIRQRLRRYTQANGSSLRLPHKVQDQQRAYSQAYNAFLREYGRKPSEAEISGFWGEDDKNINEIQKNEGTGILVRLDAAVRSPDGRGDATVGDLIPSAGCLEDEIIDRMQHEALSRELWRCVGELPEDQQQVIYQRYQAGMSFSEIGRGRSEAPAAVSRIHARAIRKLREPDKADRLRPFLSEAGEIYSAALKGGGLECFKRTWTSSTERTAMQRVK